MDAESLSWQEICEQIDLSTRYRSVSRALIALCIFHDEKSPSLWMYPDGNFFCYGCGEAGTRDDFLEKLFPGEVENDDFDLRQASVEIRRKHEIWLQTLRSSDNGEPPF